MKSYRIILNIIIILFPLALAFGDKTEKANEKFNFINEIYNESWALIIGINKYENVNRLNFAVNDANVIKKLLIEKYGFPEKNIKGLESIICPVLRETGRKGLILQPHSAQAKERS